MGFSCLVLALFVDDQCSGSYKTMRFFLLIFLSSQAISHELAPFFVVWNVGQGQFVSLIEKDFCLHSDMGGEFMSWKTLSFFLL